MLEKMKLFLIITSLGLTIFSLNVASAVTPGENEAANTEDVTAEPEPPLSVESNQLGIISSPGSSPAQPNKAANASESVVYGLMKEIADEYSKVCWEFVSEMDKLELDPSARPRYDQVVSLCREIDDLNKNLDPLKEDEDNVRTLLAIYDHVGQTLELVGQILESERARLAAELAVEVSNYEGEVE